MSLKALLLAAAALVSVPAAATVVFDPMTRQGVVDLTDVQNAFGWDAAFAQRAAPTVGFWMEEQGTRSWECVWSVGGASFRVPRSVRSTTSLPLETTTVPATRNPGQVAAFRITGRLTAGLAPGAPVEDCASVHPGAVVVNSTVRPQSAVRLYVAYPENSANRVLLRTF